MNACPSREQLQHWLADQCSPHQAETIGEHVDACSRCQQALEELTQAASPSSARPETANPPQSTSPGTAPPYESRKSEEAFLRRLQDAVPISPERQPGAPTRITLSEPLAGPAATEPERPLIPGYTIIEELGHGGMGV